MTSISKMSGAAGAAGIMGPELPTPLALPTADAASGAAKGEVIDDHKRAEVKELANEFEALFLNLVLKSMRDTVQKGGLIDGGNAEQIYKSMLDDEYSKMMAAQRNTGLGDNVERYLLAAMGDVPGAAGPGAPGASIPAPANGLPRAQVDAKALGLKAYRSQTLIDAALPATMDAGTSLTAPGPLRPSSTPKPH